MRAAGKRMGIDLSHRNGLSATSNLGQLWVADAETSIAGAGRDHHDAGSRRFAKAGTSANLHRGASAGVDPLHFAESPPDTSRAAEAEEVAPESGITVRRFDTTSKCSDATAVSELGLLLAGGSSLQFRPGPAASSVSEKRLSDE